MFADRFCPVPFTSFRVSTSGDVSLCSPTRMKIPVVGNVLRTPPAEVWNSAEAQTLRRSILDGSFSQCIDTYCPALQKGSLPSRRGIKDPGLRRVIDENLTILDTRPTMINMHLDKSCNLKCPTCRTEITVIRGKDRTRAELVRDRLLESGTLQNAESMILCGYGEVFASPIYLGFLRGIDPASYPNLKIKLLTNGLLLTEKMWRSIASAHSLISEISISVDAATAETYKINRGGNFDRLLENMDIVARLRSTGEISRFTLNFCVQTNNFREMSSFVELAQRLGCDRVHFQKLANADKAKMHDFSERAVHLPEHPGHMEFLALLIDPIFRQRIVDLYSLSGLVKTPMQEEPEPSVVGREKARFARSWRAWLRGLAAPFRRLSEVDSPAR